MNKKIYNKRHRKLTKVVNETIFIGSVSESWVNIRIEPPVEFSLFFYLCVSVRIVTVKHGIVSIRRQ